MAANVAESEDRPPEKPQRARYSEALIRRVLAHLEEHGHLGRAAEACGLSRGVHAIARWRSKGRTVDGIPLAEAINVSRQRYASRLQDELEEVMRDLADASAQADPRQAKVSALARRMQGLQWQLSKLMPNLYGERIEHAGKVEHGLTVELVQFAALTADKLHGDGKVVIEGEVERPRIGQATRGCTDFEPISDASSDQEHEG